MFTEKVVQVKKDRKPGQDHKCTQCKTADETEMETASHAYGFQGMQVHARAAGIQPKLTVNTPGDMHEQEADQVAARVMSGHPMPVSKLTQMGPAVVSRMVISREHMVDSMTPGGEEGEQQEEGEQEQTADPAGQVQRKAIGNTGAINPQVQRSINQSVQQGGERLSPGTRGYMESRMNWSFSDVKVHHDAKANTLAESLSARAFTLGNDIFFGRSEYNPGSTKGQHLLAHELAHVMQQNSGKVSRQVQRWTSCSAYSGYDRSAPIDRYNCSGLALRTYTNIGTPDSTYAAMHANFLNPVCPVGEGRPGQVKFWMWRYMLRFEDDSGNFLREAPDFHIVGGRMDAQGANPTDVYTKNGFRPVYGPGTGPSFRPPTRERATASNAAETPLFTPGGSPVFKIRNDMTEMISVANCSS